MAEHLETGEKSSAELAELTGADENKLYRIMRFLAARGLFDELPKQIFALNNESRYLLSSTSGNLKHFINLHGDYFYQGAAQIFKSMSNDLTPFEIATGKPANQLFADNESIGKIYNLAMQEMSGYYGQLVVKKYDFSSYKTIVDVGGGFGSLLVNILKSNPHIRGINFDLPALQVDAEAYFEHEGVAARCLYIGGSFFEKIPSGGDLYIFKAILHGKTDNQVIEILNNTKAVLPETGKILLIERMITPGDNFLDGCLNDINMLNVTKGGVRTYDEYHALFDSCGFSISKMELLEDALQMIELKMR